MLDYPIPSPLSNPICTNFSFFCVACQLSKTGTPTAETHGRFDSDPKGGCTPKWGRTLVYLWRHPIHGQFPFQLPPE